MEEYMTVTACRALHGESKQHHEETMQMLKEINDRLYRDNGKLSIQTRLDRGDRILGILVWTVTTAGGVLIIALLTLMWKTLAKVWLT